MFQLFNKQIIVCLLISVLEIAGDCPFPANLWCSSHRIAEQCQVLYQCQANVWKEEPNGAEPVQLALYYESLCPDCHVFVKQQLWPTYKKIANIMNITLVPYGNAMEHQDGSKWVFECQHGADECAGNLIQTCAIYTTKNITAYFPFIYCMILSEAPPDKSAPQCAKTLGINYSPIEECVDGALGNQLEHAMAECTNKLNPPHQYVPWITLFGEHTEDIQHQAETNLLKLVCDSYKGQKPSGCDEVTTALHVHRK